jgi:hypothetical protein
MPARYTHSAKKPVALTEAFIRFSLTGACTGLLYYGFLALMGH